MINLIPVTSSCQKQSLKGTTERASYTDLTSRFIPLKFYYATFFLKFSVILSIIRLVLKYLFLDGKTKNNNLSYKSTLCEVEHQNMFSINIISQLNKLSPSTNLFSTNKLRTQLLASPQKLLTNPWQATHMHTHCTYLASFPQ